MEIYKNAHLTNLLSIDNNGYLKTEQWKPIKEYNQYEISNFGRIKSLDKICAHYPKGTRLVKGKIIKQSVCIGYLKITLYKNKKPTSFRVHRLVAQHFIPNPENKPEVNHLKGDKKDNRFWMLEWNTRAENGQHSYDNGLQVSKKGSEVNGAKLTEEQVLEIRKIGKSMTLKELGSIYNVSISCISSILNNKIWTYLL